MLKNPVSFKKHPARQNSKLNIFLYPRQVARPMKCSTEPLLPISGTGSLVDFGCVMLESPTSLSTACDMGHALVPPVCRPYTYSAAP